MHGKFPAIQQNQRNSILFHETIPLNYIFTIHIFKNHIEPKVKLSLTLIIRSTGSLYRVGARATLKFLPTAGAEGHIKMMWLCNTDYNLFMSLIFLQ
jgi:hypothetical protein